MPSNPMRDHHQRTLAQKQQQAKANQSRPLGGFRLGHASAEKTAIIEKIAQHVINDQPSNLEPTGTNFELRMFNDLQRLKSIQSIHGEGGRIDIKRELFPQYMPYIDGTLAVPSSVQNDVLMHLMVWALDVAEYAYALRIAEYALLNNLVMPEPYSRDVGNIFAEQLAEGLIDDPAIAQHADLIEKAIDLVRGVDLVDQVRAKLYKAQGLSMAAYRPKEALGAYETALRLDPKVGAKQAIDKLKRDLAKGNADPESPRDTPSGSQDTDHAQALPADPASTAPNLDPSV